MAKGEIRIRLHASDDDDALITLYRDSVRIVARRDYTHEQVMAWAPDEIDHAAWAARRANRPTWVAEFDGVPVGFVDLEPDGHIDMLFVHADYQRRGIASVLLGQVEETAHDQGLTRLHTEASITARPFFERRGFRMVAPQTVVLRGQAFVNYRMEKLLA